MTDRSWQNNGCRRPLTDAEVVKEKTAVYTVTGEDHDCVIVENNVVGFTITLPSAADYPGMRVTLANKVANTSGEFLVAVNGTDFIRGNGLAETASKGVRNTQATCRKGDNVTLVSDGGSGWYITGISGTWAIEA